jgi:hypothetical protein
MELLIGLSSLFVLFTASAHRLGATEQSAMAIHQRQMFNDALVAHRLDKNNLMAHRGSVRKDKEGDA